MSDVKRFLKTIWTPGDVREIRAFDKLDGISYGYFDNIDIMEREVLKIQHTHMVYITLNPCKPELIARCCNKIKRAGKKEPTTTDKDIASLKYLLIDCDPKRPANISSSNEEKELAENLAKKILAELGSPVFVGDSGNGYHLIYKHNAGDEKQLKEFLSELNQKYGSEEVAIDTSVFNPSRITKVLGTWARKGENHPTRPWRQSRMLQIYETPIILSVPKIETRKPSIQAVNTVFDARKFLADNGIIIKQEKSWNDCTMLVLENCVFDNSHKGKEASVLIHSDGKLSYQCFHNSCQGKTWQDLRNAVGRPRLAVQTQCKYCGVPITWIKDGDVNIPMEDETTRHMCRKESRHPHPEIMPHETTKIEAAEKQIEQESLIEQKSFPLWIYPKSIKTWLNEISESTQTPIDFGACALLPVAGMLLAKSTIAMNVTNTWVERPGIYLAISCDTGAGKTQVVKAIMKSVFDIERSLHEKYKNEKKEYDINLENYLNQSKQSRDAKTRPIPPQNQSLFTTNATTESLGKLLYENPGLLLLKDELTGWIKSMNQYRGGRGDDVEFFLSSFSGSSYKVNRVNQEPMWIENPVLCLIGSIVPENIHVLVPETRDGFVERILFTFPEKREKNWPEITIDETNKKYCEYILYSFFQNRERHMTLSPEAQSIFKNYYIETHKRIVKLPNTAHLKGFLEKILSYVGRFALILNALHENGDVVPEIIMHAAIDLANYFIAHVEKTTQKLSSSKEQQDTNGVLEWAKRKGFEEINVRILVRAGLPGCKNVEGAKEKLQELVDLEQAIWLKYGKEVQILQKKMQEKKADVV